MIRRPPRSTRTDTLFPYTTLFRSLGDVLVEAGIPKGVFNHVFVPGAVAAKLVSDPRVKALSFTGSTGVGRKLAIDAATSSTRLQLEMGGKNPLVVLDDADLNRAVAVALDGAFFGRGTRCTRSEEHQSELQALTR